MRLLFVQEEAMADFSKKNQHYMSIYESVQETEGVPFLKVGRWGRRRIRARVWVSGPHWRGALREAEV